MVTRKEDDILISIFNEKLGEMIAILRGAMSEMEDIDSKISFIVTIKKNELRNTTRFEHIPVLVKVHRRIAEKRVDISKVMLPVAAGNPDEKLRALLTFNNGNDVIHPRSFTIVTAAIL